jgi:MerR family transcriptional regulator, mercuric resistance operon regulatory protein
LPSPERQGRYRRYSTGDIKRLVFVRRARELGFTLNEVRALLQLSETDGMSACNEVREISAAHLADVRRRIADRRPASHGTRAQQRDPSMRCRATAGLPAD